MGKLVVVVPQVLSFPIRLSRLGWYPRQGQLFGKCGLLWWMMKVALLGYVETFISICTLTSKICTCVGVGRRGILRFRIMIIGAMSDSPSFFSEQNLIEQWNVIMDVTYNKTKQM